MKAKIKSFYSPDINDLENYNPIDTENFCFLLELLIGPDKENGEESFNIQVCTPKWFLSNMKRNDIILGNHFLIVIEYDFKRIFNHIEKLIESCSGKDWDEVSEKVSRIGHWEFENYIE